jgi:glycyl-tRNA synthetase
MLEVSCAAMTPHVVLHTSGHVDRFTDYMVRDTKNTDLVYRADKLLEEVIDKKIEESKDMSETDRNELLTIRSAAGSYNKDQLSAAFKRFNIVSPDTGNPLTEPFAFNLMFTTSIGPTGKLVGYLRPETAQGIFVNFRRLLDYNQNKMPFAAAQIGLAFRNEIAPRSGLLRVREFSLAEIEHFVHPNEKQHPKFSDTADLVLPLLPREDQHGEEKVTKLTARDAVAKGVVDNETLAYYLARTQLFLLAIGIKYEKLRFRQHKHNEMAHYASDVSNISTHSISNISD